MSEFEIKCKVPSGKKIYVKELKNKTYIALHKFVMNNDLEGFYRTLDNHISSSFEEIQSLSILDKLFIYLSIYAYSIKAQIELSSKTIDKFGQEEIYSIFEVLEEMQNIKVKNITESFETKQGTVLIEIGLPTQFEEVDDEFTFNPLSAVKKVNLNSQNYVLKTPEDFKVLNFIFTPENYYKLTNLIIQNFNFNIPLIKGKVELPILSNVTYKFIAESLYYNDLDYILTTIYSLLKHLNLAPSEYSQLTPADSEILLLKLIKDKKEEQKEAAKQQENNSYGQQLPYNF